MPDFSEIQNNLIAALAARDNAKQQLYLKEQKLKQLKSQRERLDRSFDESRSGDISRKTELEMQYDDLDQTIKSERKVYGDYKLNVEAILEQYQLFSDPREHMSRMSDQYPFMLLPLRIETRFKKVTLNGRHLDQLWVRVYPDDVAVDTFEETLSTTEVESARTYWLGMWQAGGREAMERAAWRGLVSSYGSGRARYITEEYIPLNQADVPATADSHQLFLTIAVEQLPPSTEITAIQDYWKASWLAGKNPDKQSQAYDDLLSVLSGSPQEREERAAEIIKTLKPSNFDDNSRFSEEGVEVSVIFIHFKQESDIDTKEQSWSQAPVTHVLPDRLVITGYSGVHSTEGIAFQEIGNIIPSPLVMGPDPSLGKEEQIKSEEGVLKVNDDFKWMVDFEEAVTKGMGFKINLTETQASRGFDRIVVLGVKLDPNASKSASAIEKLLKNHERSKKGLALLPQGTPTNNTSDQDSGYSYYEDSDVSFDFLKSEKQFDRESDWMLKKDGQWLAEWLGIDTDAFQKTYNGGLSDQTEARAMNTALFPATLGYMMESLMAEVFNDDDVEKTRWFLNNFVSGRGPVPAIKIGRQPYGIFPTTKWDDMRWINLRKMPRPEGIPWEKGNEFFISRLYEILKKIDADWQPLMKDVAFVGKGGEANPDAHQLLLDIVGLAPNSLEYYQRYAESDTALVNRFKLLGWFGGILGGIIAGAYTKSGMDLLREFNLKIEEVPEILKKFFLRSENKLYKALVDDNDLSETNPIRNYTTDNKNYIEWLIQAARTSHNTLRQQKGFIDGKVPSTLLYLMLKHALDVGYINTSLFLNLQANVLDTASYKRAKIDPEFLHIKTQTPKTESRWQYLYEPNLSITGNQSLLVGDYIPQVIHTELASSYLRKQLDALEHLKTVPTARLERVLTEHIDLCTYRLDAWKNGLMNYQLAAMRFREEEEPGNNYPVEDDNYSSGKGTYLGAYGWLENIRPENKVLTPKNLTDPKLIDEFNQPDEPQLVTDNSNGGYIGAPSLNHAVTAAILRNAYMAEGNPETFEINLSSERVRKALSIIEGIRAGQNLAALLGYYLERELHDQNHSLTQVDYYIHKLRKAFPLSSDKIKSTKTEDTDAIEAIEANNVVDGLQLINHIKTSGKNTYPFGKSVLPNSGADAPSEEIKTAINEQVKNIMNLNDAVADIAMAESVHQVVLGNYDRAAATMDTYSKGNFPPIPDVIQTPRSGTNITQRFGLQFDTGIDIAISPNSMPLSPRAKAEPLLNNWLTSVLPPENEVMVKASYLDAATSAETEVNLSQKQLQLQPLDLLYIVNTENDQAMTALDDRIEKYIRDNNAIRPDVEVKIHYTERLADKINFFELAALMHSLRSLILQSRPLEPMDVSVPSEAQSVENERIFLDESRIVQTKTALENLISEVDTYLATLSPLTADTEANKPQLLSSFDDLIESLLAILSKMELYGLPQSGTGFAFEKKRVIYGALFTRVEELISRWEEQLNAFDVALSTYDALPPEISEADRFVMLYNAERLIATLPETPQPDTAVEFRNKLNGKRAGFVAKLDQFRAIVSANPSKVSGLLQSVTATLPVSNFDFHEYSTEAQVDAMLQFTVQLESLAKAIKVDIGKRADKAQQLIDEAVLLSPGKKRTEIVQSAAKAIFGEDFKMIPEFEVPGQQADEWLNSYLDQNQLLSHLVKEEGDFPIDEWMYSLARVREKIHHWENVVNLKEAFTNATLPLNPVQFPYQPNDYWLALEFPKDYELSNDKILYTAHYAKPFSKTGRQCGLLLDEWTEVIPSKTEDVGVTFHYDRPNSEPPQVILLAMPSEFTGSWQWNNLLDVVNDTLDQAKKRALEPQQIDKTVYARFLPATVSSVSKYPFTASLNYSFNNLLFDHLKIFDNE